MNLKTLYFIVLYINSFFFFLTFESDFFNVIYQIKFHNIIKNFQILGSYLKYKFKIQIFFNVENFYEWT